MKRTKLGLGLAALAAAGALFIPGRIGNNETNKPRDIENLKVYIEQPGLNQAVKEGLDFVYNTKSSDFTKTGIAHPYSRVVGIYYAGDKKERITRWVFSYEPPQNTNLRKETLDKMIDGKPYEEDVTVTEEEVSPNNWRFKQLDVLNPNSPKVKNIRNQFPWIFDAAENNRPYTMKTITDNEGKVRTCIYSLHDGKTVTLEDTNSNCIADRVK
jgi:hypothetical protein